MIMTKSIVAMGFGLCCFLLGATFSDLENKKCWFEDWIIVLISILYGLITFIGLVLL